ncbi:alpha/beta hydrolase [Rhodococcus sp. NPDC057014]|uniref:alpha/beta hydrolase n=1 Tax=Rhodococcus sp. NPDC057014 TaxID=3346000 RepID=UPI003633E5FD
MPASPRLDCFDTKRAASEYRPARTLSRINPCPQSEKDLDAMVSERANAVATEAYGAWHSPTADLASLRKGFDNMLPEPADDVVVAESTVAGIPGRWVSTPTSGSTVVLYVHGGGFILGSSFGYRGLAARIARVSDASAFIPDYRLAPETPFPGAFDDVVAVYRGLITDQGISPHNIAIAADSAGGGLALAAVVALRDAGDPLPAALTLLSPFGDLTLSANSLNTNESLDPINTTRGAAEQGVALYIGEGDATDPRASAMFSDLTGLPPLLVQAGTAEIVLDDAIRIAENARKAGVDVDLQLSYDMIHVYQMFADQLPEGQAAIEEIGKFIQRHVGAR